MNNQIYLQFAIKIAKQAGKVLEENFKQEHQISHKGPKSIKYNLVTETDRQSEQLIVRAIKKNFPTHSVLGEEYGNSGTGSSEYRWIIDPLDGTTNYIHGYHFFAVSIGVEIKGEIVAGVVYAPLLKELFTASKGGGAFLNGKPLHVSKAKKLEDSLLATGFQYRDEYNNIPHLSHFLPLVHGIRRSGSAAIDMCYVAAGRYEAYWEGGIYPWDIAAGSLIVGEAGGKVSALDGSALKLDNRRILASNGLVHREMSGYFKKY